MKSLKNRTAVIILAIIVLILAGYHFDIYPDNSPKGTFNRAWRLIKNNYVDKTCNHQDWGRWKRKYGNQIKTYDDAHVAIDSMIESLGDPYSRFLSKCDFSEQDMNMDAKLQGIGVHITDLKGKVYVISVIEGSPAEKAGLKTKDEIIKVGSVSTKGLDLSKVAELIRGKEGSIVNLSLLRDGKLFTKKIKREEIKIKTVQYKMLENKIAYIRISSFISFDTANEFRSALYKAKDANGLVIDVRGNYGGLLTNAIYISNMLLENGTIVSIVDRNGKKQDYLAQGNGFMTNKPAVVLVDEASASASEIFSGAMKDHKRATIIGENTFGKGKVQMIMKLPDESGINLTVAKYLTPSGVDIDHKGVKPDYVIKTDRAGFEKKGDICLNKAVELLTQKREK